MTTAIAVSAEKTRHCGCGAEVTGAGETVSEFFARHRDCGDVQIVENRDRPWVELNVYVGTTLVAWSWPSPAGRTWEVKQVQHDNGDVDTITVGSRRQAETALRMLATAFAYGTGR